MKEAPGSSETSVLTRATRRNNPESTILHSHRRENLKSYIEEWCLLGCYAVTSQKTSFFTVTAVKTSNLTLKKPIYLKNNEELLVVSE
jgi:uncharacterized protein YutD